MATKRTLCVLLMALMVSGVFFGCLGTGKAESISKPSIPSFTIAYIDKSYDISPTTTIDPYNGQTITTQGSHVKASAIEIRIKNEAFTPFTTDSGKQVGYYYNIRWKGHFENTWTYAFAANYGSGYFPRSGGAETVFSTDGQYTCGFHIPSTKDFSPGDQIDFQVEAMIGYVVDPGPYDSEVFEGQVSGWSSTQTVTILGASASVSPSPTVPEYPFMAILPLLGLVPVIVIVLVRKKKVLT
ncbi:MAG TPA: hypothetical protein VLH35_01410 [Candidatus Acidoferrales bacterium]|nr:hypothetical protein [Candidatus Acidoferrales bacterium]